jgi:PLP dependent protein
MSYSWIPDRVAAVRERISDACDRAGRSADDVRIVAVTKNHPPEAVLAIMAAGVHDAGENRIQEMEEKVTAVGRDSLRWHLIGHLQRNKARKALELADLVHSIDSVRLAERLSELARERGRRVDVLVQVNVAGEETKGGLEIDDALDGIGAISALPGLRVGGLMTMAPFTDDEGVVRSVFSRTRLLQEEAARSVPGFEPRHLSMGMSGDFEIAVEEGSTLVRLGTILLGEREQ